MVSDEHFKGKAALVTGGTDGIGREIVRELVEMGTKVAFCGRSPAKVDAAAKEFGEAVLGVRCDVRFPEQVDNLVSRAVAAFGTPDYLVNNAGLYPVHPFLEMTEEQWDEVLDTNLKGAFMVGQRVARKMVESGRGGSIVNIGSTSSLIARPGVAHYCSSKAGINMLTKVMAVELAPHGIRVNALCPGLIGTDSATSIVRTPEGEREFRAKLGKIPVGRVGTPAEIARSVIHLLSPDSSYTTASVIYVDGGYTAGINTY